MPGGEIHQLGELFERRGRHLCPLRLCLVLHLGDHAFVRFNVVAQAEVHRLIERATLVGVEVADLDHVAGAYAVFFSS